MNPLLKISDLRVIFPTSTATVNAVNGLNLTVEPGQSLGVVGESGCGKTVTALSIMRLLPYPGKIASGSISFRDEDLTEKTEDDMMRIRGSSIAMIFQDPSGSLNPSYTIGNQIVEGIQLQEAISGKEAFGIAMDALEMVNIPDPQRRLNNYPHELSRGMCQRVMIAMALSRNPKLLIADEPTTALDVTVGAQILDLIKAFQKKLDMSMIVITHDFGVIDTICDRVAVMYAGKIVEEGPTRDVVYGPQHPYTQGLKQAIPKLGQRTLRLHTIHGDVPNMMNVPSGCAFHPRCPHAMDICNRREPLPIENRVGQMVACHLYDKE